MSESNSTMRFVIEANNIGASRYTAQRNLPAGSQVIKPSVRIIHGVVGLNTKASVTKPVLNGRFQPINDGFLVIDRPVYVPFDQRIILSGPNKTAIAVEVRRVCIGLYVVEQRRLVHLANAAFLSNLA